MTAENLPKAGYKLAKIAVGGVILLGLAATTMVYAQAKPLHVADKVELDKYLGVWYEIARKPMSFQNQCDSNVTATYTFNENGNVLVDNRCTMKDGQQSHAIGEAFVQNAPFNTKLKVSCLPEAIRWLPAGRGDYWISKIDENYQTVLVGEPSRKYMWVLSRDPHPDPRVVNEYLDYAKSVGYDLKNLIRTKHTVK